MTRERDCEYRDRDYASKGVAGTGLGFGIAGTALGLAALARNNYGGGLVGLFGGGQQPRNVSAGGGDACTELDILSRFLMPIMGEISDLKAQAAVNTAVGIERQRMTDAQMAWMARSFDYEIDAKTCRFVPGEVFLSPNRMADPYQGGTNVIVARHMSPCATNYGCGQAYSGCGCGW